MKIRQLCTRIEFGDAVSNHVLEIARALSSWGYENEVFANTTDEYGRMVSRPDCEYRPENDAADDILIYHYSVFCRNYELYLASAAKRVLIYHNITPPEFFEAYDKGAAAFCRLGRELLPKLAGCDLALGDSEFNRRELVEAGFDSARTGVLPIFVNYEGLRETRVDDNPMAGFESSFKVLFVGRTVPNKRLEDVLRAFYYYNRCVNSASDLFIVGAKWVDKYDAQLQWLVDSFGLWGSVHFTGRVSDPQLAACYRDAGAYLSMSEHEGFAVPMVECMAFDLPIVAYSTTAIPFTLEGAGLAFEAKDFAMVGELLESVRADRPVREAAIASQRARLEAFAPGAVRRDLKDALARLTGGPS
ncbi:MAG: glycosyltransferase [Candidatus Geothermincolia bacterium]